MPWTVLACHLVTCVMRIDFDEGRALRVVETVVLAERYTLVYQQGAGRQ
ncbi:hypothetical protein WKI65_43755 [Streptomyces sp. MS1.AVA.3]